MLHFLQQRFLLLQQRGHLPFGGALIGNVFDRQKNELLSSLIENLARIQEHRASSDNGENSLDLVSLHHGVLWRDFPQQQSKLGDIPLTNTKLVNWTTLNVLRVHPKRSTEGAACGDDTQLLIEDQKRIADRIHDRLGERAPGIEVDGQLTARPRQRGSRYGARSIVRRFHVHLQEVCSPKSPRKLPPAGRRLPRLPQFLPQLLRNPPPPRTSLMTGNSNNAPMAALMIAETNLSRDAGRSKLTNSRPAQEVQVPSSKDRRGECEHSHLHKRI